MTIGDATYFPDLTRITTVDRIVRAAQVLPDHYADIRHDMNCVGKRASENPWSTYDPKVYDERYLRMAAVYMVGRARLKSDLGFEQLYMRLHHPPVQISRACLEFLRTELPWNPDSSAEEYLHHFKALERKWASNIDRGTRDMVRAWYAMQEALVQEVRCLNAFEDLLAGEVTMEKDARWTRLHQF